MSATGYMLRTRRRGSTVIELSIPLQYGAAPASSASSSDDAEDSTCYICAEAFCGSDECCRSLTHLTCCTQPICTGCMIKTAKRCTCKDECDQVIAFCPFCRMISPCEALDLFRGACLKPCRRCVAAAAEPAAEAAPGPAGDNNNVVV